MTNTNLLTDGLLLFASCIGLAACLLLGSQLIKQDKSNNQEIDYFSGITLLASAFVWAAAVWNLLPEDSDLTYISSLPPSASGTITNNELIAHPLYPAQTNAPEQKSGQLLKIQLWVAQALHAKYGMEPSFSPWLQIPINDEDLQKEISNIVNFHPERLTMLISNPNDNPHIASLYTAKLIENNLTFQQNNNNEIQALAQLLRSRLASNDL